MRGRGAALLVACGVIAAISLGVAAQAARLAHAESVRGPSKAEVTAAARAGVAQRWEQFTLGQIFPASVGYGPARPPGQTAVRLGIGAGDSCDEAIDGTLDRVARHWGCVAAIRASYADDLDGTVYTVGVMVFPGNGAAREFAKHVPSGGDPATGLSPLALPRTAAALFMDESRQLSALRVTGPYVVLAVAGYADGRRAGQATEPRPSVFGPAADAIVSAVVAPLAAPEPVRCGNPEWTC